MVLFEIHDVNPGPRITDVFGASSVSFVQVESFWSDFIIAAQKSRGDWPSLLTRSEAMAEAGL